MPLAASPTSPVGRRLATLAAGLVLVAVGVGLCIRAEVGVAPYDVLTTGVADATGLPIGFAAIVPPVVFTALGVALGGRPGPGTLAAVFAIGPILGLALALVPEVDRMAVRIPLYAGGVLAIAAGITAVVIAELGPGPAELVMLAVHDRGHPLATVRTVIELASVAVGWALGGQVGAGTALFAFSIGPLLRRMLTATGYRADAAEASTAAAPGG